jgi:hypothetical protein
VGQVAHLEELSQLLQTSIGGPEPNRHLARPNCINSCVLYLRTALVRLNDRITYWITNLKRLAYSQEDGTLHSHRRLILKSYTICNCLSETRTAQRCHFELLGEQSKAIHLTGRGGLQCYEVLSCQSAQPSSPRLRTPTYILSKEILKCYLFTTATLTYDNQKAQYERYDKFHNTRIMLKSKNANLGYILHHKILCAGRSHALDVIFMNLSCLNVSEMACKWPRRKWIQN